MSTPRHALVVRICPAAARATLLVLAAHIRQLEEDGATVPGELLGAIASLEASLGTTASELLGELVAKLRRLLPVPSCQP